MVKVSNITLDRGWAIMLEDLGIDGSNVVRRAELPFDLMT